MHNRNSLGLLSYAPTPGVAQAGSCLSQARLIIIKGMLMAFSCGRRPKIAVFVGCILHIMH